MIKHRVIGGTYGIGTVRVGITYNCKERLIFFCGDRGGLVGKCSLVPLVPTKHANSKKEIRIEKRKKKKAEVKKIRSKKTEAEREEEGRKKRATAEVKN